MGKCLVTKLQGSVDNPNLLKIGEMPIYVKKSTESVGAQYKLTVLTSKDSEINIVGDGYFTDSTMAENKGKTASIPANVSTTVYFSNGDYYALISNKYDIVNFILTDDGSARLNCLYIDVDKLKYSNNLKILKLTSSDSFGNVGVFQNKKMKDIYINNTNIEGDINYINITNIINFNISAPKVSFDLKKLAGTTNITSVAFADNTLQTGDFANLKENTGMKYLGIIGKGLSLNVEDLSNFKSLKQPIIQIFTDNVSGNIGVVNNLVSFITNNKVREYTYTETTRTNILGVSNVKLSNIDKFLNDMSALQPMSNYKVMNLFGTRTSSSDAAVQTLQSKGYTVSITPA